MIPPFLSVGLYVMLPWVYGRNLHLKDTSDESIENVSHILGLSEFHRVKTSPLSISPLIYGRRGKTAVFVLPERTSFLTGEEEKAVIAHELSHVHQGDVGFFTWLTLLIKGLIYWIIVYPLVVWVITDSYRIYGGTFVFIILIPLLVFSLILLKNSLSRTRESIADAYTVFYGFGEPLKKALVKFAAVRSYHKGILNLWSYRQPVFLATHPPLLKRIRDIEEKTFLTESMKVLSFELALWTGLSSAFLFYALYRSTINFLVVFDLSLSDSGFFVTWFIVFFAVANVVAASYVFPITKESVLFLDLGRSQFVVSLLRNMVVTLVSAALVSYGLSLDMQYTWQVTTAVVGGFLLWFLGFTGARRSDFSHGDEYLVLAPISWALLLWVPLQMVYTLVGIPYDAVSFSVSMFTILVLALVIVLILMEKGKLLMNRREKILMFWGRKKEVPRVRDMMFVFLVLFLLMLPAVLSFSVCTLSLFFDMIVIPPVRNFLIYGVILLLGVYGLKNSDIFFFHKIRYLVGIVVCDRSIEKETIEFVESVVREYQSPDGGFDYAGVGFSNQKDTFYFVETAELLGIQVDKDDIVEWIYSTENEEGGFALYPGGYPRVEGLYYAARSLDILVGIKNMDKHVKWVLTSFNGEYFHFENDTDSLLMQTCYAMELLKLFNVLYTINLIGCKKWIEKQFSENLKSREAFFITKALRILDSSTELAEKWLENNKRLSGTRVDKNLEEVYYYVMVLRELNKTIPPLIIEQAARELSETRQECRGKQ
jgi:hypothetical protein